MHHDVGDELDELAIADFLLFGFNQTLDTTSLQSIRRLPPGHVLRRKEGKSTAVERYWTLPCDDIIRYRHQPEYVEHFEELFTKTVSDRLRGNTIGVSMSGGLDSTSIATIAHGLLSKTGRPFDLHLYTNVYDRLIPDDERLFASEVARSLNNSIHFESLDDVTLNAGWDSPGIELPEPFHDFTDRKNSRYCDYAANCRVMLSGLGGDPLLTAPSAYIVKRILRGEWSQLAAGLWSCCRAHGHLPSIGLRSLVLGRLHGARHRLEMPAWLNGELVRRLDLRARWKKVMAPPPDRHTTRPEAYSALENSTWQHCFAALDPASNRVPIEQRHPFFDVRLVRFVLAMPNQPWFVRKAILREAMKGVLPEAVRLRPKTVLRGDPAHAVAPGFDRRCRERLLSAPALSRFVDKDAFPVHMWDKATLAYREYCENVRPLSLGYWLKYCWPGPSRNLARGDL
jgi:asparagine synthase (glutamine-hydrolysing)